MTTLADGAVRGDEPPATPATAPGRGSAAGSSGTGVGYQRGFDGLKATSVIAILVYHSEVSWLPGGFLGVSQFFTLSGFLITSILLRSHDRGGIHLSRFWVRRLRRLMPAALACLAWVVVFGATVADRDQAADLPRQVLAAATYWSNWLFVITETSYAGLFASPSPVQHFWSLSVEEQFYVVMPITTFLLLRRTRSTVVLAGVFAAGALASTAWMAHLHRAGAGTDRIYYGTDTRMAEMLAGAILAVVLAHKGTAFGARTRRVLAAVAVLALAASAWAMATVSLTDDLPWRGGMLGYAALSCALLLGVLSHRGPVARFYGWGPLPAIGRVTYGLYLYHWPIFLWLTPERTGLGPWALFALRAAVTAVVATASYHYLEMPIRDGSLLGVRGRARVLVVPVAVVLLVGATFLTVDRSAPDRLATLRDADRSLSPPVQAADGVLDIMIVTDEATGADGAGGGVIDRIEAIGRKDPAIRVVDRTSFACGGLEQREGRPICADWVTRWPDVIAEQDPDVVLLYVAAWSDDELRRLSGAGAAGLEPFAADVLDNGFDLLAAEGAPIVFAAPGASFGVDLARGNQAFFRAMSRLEAERDDLRHVLGGRLPEPDLVPRADFVEGSAAALLTDASLYQRADHGGVSKVMVLGDSQARSLGYGLERWGAQEGEALVWNIASEGCGVAVDGVLRAGDVEAPISAQCRDAVDAYAARVAEFDPDVVVVLSSLWDLQPRRLAGWEDFHEPGEPAYDRYLLDAYTRAVDALAAEGATVVWATAPCIDLDAGPGGAGPAPSAPQRFDHLNDVVLPELERRRPDQVALFDLDEVLCPNGRGLEEIDGVSPIRADGAHFTVDGSLWFAAAHGPELLQLGSR